MARSYTVQQGDTLTAIVLREGLCSKGPGNTLKDWQPCLTKALEVAWWSGIKDANIIRPGDVLQLEAPDSAPPGPPPVPVDPAVLPIEQGSPLTKLVLGVGGLILLAMVVREATRRKRERPKGPVYGGAAASLNLRGALSGLKPPRRRGKRRSR